MSLQNVKITRRQVDENNTMIYLKWSIDSSLEEWKIENTIEWRKFAAIIPNTYVRARHQIREAGLTMGESATWTWNLPESDDEDSPNVMAWFKIPTDQVDRAVEIIKRALIETLGRYEAPHVPVPPPQFDADESD